MGIFSVCHCLKGCHCQSLKSFGNIFAHNSKTKRLVEKTIDRQLMKNNL